MKLSLFFNLCVPQYVICLRDIFLLELLIGTRESKDSRVQAGLASPNPLQRIRQTRQKSPKASSEVLQSSENCSNTNEESVLKAIDTSLVAEQTAKLRVLGSNWGVKTRYHSCIQVWKT